MSIILAVIAKVVSALALVLSYVSSTASIFWANHEPKMPSSMIEKQMEK